MMLNNALVAALLLASMAAPVRAGVVGSREHANTTEHGHSSTSTVSAPLAPVLGRALVAAGVPEASALQPCVAGWPASPIFARAQALAWAAQQARAACVVNAAETALAGRLTRRTWASPTELQQAADGAARRLDLSSIRRACPLPKPAAVVLVSGDEVQAQIGGVALACDAQGVTVSREGAVLFGGGTINGREYSVALEQSAGGSASDKSSVGGAFLSP